MLAVRLSSSKSSAPVSSSQTMFSITVPNWEQVSKIAGSASRVREMVLA